MRRRFLPCTAGERHASPQRILAPQRGLAGYSPLPSAGKRRMSLAKEISEEILEPGGILDFREMSDAFPLDVLSVRCHLQKRALIALAMRPVRQSPDSERGLRDRRERRRIDIRPKPGLDQRCEAEITPVRKALAGLSKKSFGLLCATDRIRVRR